MKKKGKPARAPRSTKAKGDVQARKEKLGGEGPLTPPRGARDCRIHVPREGRGGKKLDLGSRPQETRNRSRGKKSGHLINPGRLRGKNWGAARTDKWTRASTLKEEKRFRGDQLLTEALTALL